MRPIIEVISYLVVHELMNQSRYFTYSFLRELLDSAVIHSIMKNQVQVKS